MQLDDLYRQVIMDHYQHPRNTGSLGDDAIDIDLRNPSCGDEITLQLVVEDGMVRDVKFQGSGCSISMASASMMTEAIMNKPLAEAIKLSHSFQDMLKGHEVDGEDLGDLESLQGVAKFPARYKCATLAWQALEKALAKENDNSH